MFKCKMKSSPEIFHDTFTLKSENKYTMRSTLNRVQKQIVPGFFWFFFRIEVLHLFNDFLFIY